jgi:hypothetical protein
MMHGDVSVWWLIGVAAVGAAVALGFQLSTDSRLRRRRRKNHSRVVSKTSRPSIKFSVRPPKD